MNFLIEYVMNNIINGHIIDDNGKDKHGHD